MTPQQRMKIRQRTRGEVDRIKGIPEPRAAFPGFGYCGKCGKKRALRLVGTNNWLHWLCKKCLGL